MPFLINLNEDPAISGQLIYYLQPGTTYLGKSEQQDGPNTILLTGLKLRDRHCIFNYADDAVTIAPFDPKDFAQTFVNGEIVMDTHKLCHGK